MPHLSFQAQFVPLVESDKKNQTIRKERKNPIKVGDTLKLYANWRTPETMLIKEVVCVQIIPIKILETGIKIMGCRIGDAGRHSIAVDDGFPNFLSMCAWFDKTHGLPFEGVLIKWRDK